MMAMSQLFHSSHLTKNKTFVVPLPKYHNYQFFMKHSVTGSCSVYITTITFGVRVGSKGFVQSNN